MIPYGRQELSQADIDAVVEVLNSDYLTQGPKLPVFEETVANKVGAEYSSAMNSATSALHVACMALELAPGETLWTTPITFVSSANCGLFCGALIDFVDIDPLTYNLCPKSLEAKLIMAEKSDKLPKVVVAVHLCGQPCDMQAIYELSLRYGFKIIEDASHAIGGKYKGEYIGNCRFSDITVFSFHPVKIITTGEGGMLLTNDKRLLDKINLYRSHGITRDPNSMTHEPDGPWYYQQVELGYNYRMSDLGAALGVSQMKRLDEFVARRHKLANRYDEFLKNLPAKIPWQHPSNYSSMHLYVIRLQLNKIDKTRIQVFQELRDRNIGVNVHYIPVHTQPYYEKMGFKKGDFPEAERYYREAISLPIYSGMSENQQNEVFSALDGVLGE